MGINGSVFKSQRLIGRKEGISKLSGTSHETFANNLRINLMHEQLIEQTTAAVLHALYILATDIYAYYKVLWLQLKAAILL